MTVSSRNDAERLMAAQRTLEHWADAEVRMLEAMPDARLAEVLGALAVMRPDAARDVFVPPASTGPVGQLPVRMVTLNDARVLATAVRGYITLVDTLHGALGTSGMDGDVRDRLERVILELNVPES
jgi:hypothetical protein